MVKNCSRLCALGHVETITLSPSSYLRLDSHSSSSANVAISTEEEEVIGSVEIIVLNRTREHFALRAYLDKFQKT